MTITTLQDVRKFINDIDSLERLYLVWNPDKEEQKRRKKNPVVGQDALQVIGRAKSWNLLLDMLSERFPECNTSIEKMFLVDSVLDCYIPRDMLLGRAYDISLKYYKQDIVAFAQSISRCKKTQLFTSLMRRYIFMYVRPLQQQSWSPQVLVDFANACDHWDVYQGVAGLFVERAKLTELDIVALGASNNSNLSHETILSLRS